jgi:GNAT superfamily N-acetyltransferase
MQHMINTSSRFSALSRAFKPRRAVVWLTQDDRAALLAHYLALSDDDRNCRFGAGCSDAAVGRFVDGLDLRRVRSLAVRAPDGALLAVAHVPVEGGVAELGISVAPEARRQGLGALLARRALAEARRAGAQEFAFQFAAANDGMRRLAARLRMATERFDTEWVARRPLASVIASA